MNLELEMDMHNDIMNDIDIDAQEENDADDNINLPIMIDFNREYYTNLCNDNEVMKKDDPYSVKQYLKISLYLIFMKEQEIFISNRLELVKKLKIMRKFIEHKIYHWCGYHMKYRVIKRIDKKILKETLFKNKFVTSERTKYNDFDVFSKSLERTKITNETYKEIMNIYNVEKHTEEMTKENSRVNISNQVDMIGMQCLKLNNVSQNNVKDLKYKMKESENLHKNCLNVLKMTEKIKNNCEKIYYYKLSENTREIKRNHCKNTILLNVNSMINTLNNDIINIIRSFVGETLIENIRMLGVQKRYFNNPKETLKKMLCKWKRVHLHNYIKSHYYMMFSFDNIQSNIFEYDREDFMEYYYFREIDELYYIDSLPLSNDNSKQQYINDALNTNNIAEYYHFQKDVFILSKIMKTSRK